MDLKVSDEIVVSLEFLQELIGVQIMVDSYSSIIRCRDDRMVMFHKLGIANGKFVAYGYECERFSLLFNGTFDIIISIIIIISCDLVVVSVVVVQDCIFKMASTELYGATKYCRGGG
jgi:hypothetical protein